MVIPSHADLDAWRDRMQERTLRQFSRDGGTPPGWHVLLPGGDFGFHDVTWPATPDEHEELVRRMRTTLQSLGARACLFVRERELGDGRPVLVFQYEGIDGRGTRRRETRVFAIRAGADGVRRAVPLEAASREAPSGTAAAPSDSSMTQASDRDGPFPDLLPDSSPLRIR